MTQPLNFRAERDQSSDSWTRADPRTALVEATDAPGNYHVTLRGGRTHNLVYEKRDGAYRGRCDCKGWKYRSDPHSPCAHLVTLRKAEVLDLTTVRGRPIQPHSNDSQPDGGHIEAPPAGHDQQPFGRPESRLTAPTRPRTRTRVLRPTPVGVVLRTLFSSGTVAPSCVSTLSYAGRLSLTGNEVVA